MSAPVVIVVKRHFSAPPELVFDAWIDPKQASKWLFATENGVMIRAEADARVGGTFVFTDRRPDMGDVEHTGTYIEVERPHRLVFTFGVPAFSPGFDRVSISIRPTEHGGCELTLTHEMKPEHEEYRDGSEKGWTKMLGRLRQLLDGTS
jgi:uncharacterized protein YndB with AHSA1/START domain